MKKQHSIAMHIACFLLCCCACGSMSMLQSQPKVMSEAYWMFQEVCARIAGPDVNPYPENTSQHLYWQLSHAASKN